MRIGIDARFLTHSQRGGFKTYTENLIGAMRGLDEKNQYFVYVDRPLVACKESQRDNWHYIVVPGTFPLIGMPLREQWLLKRQIRNDKLDIIHLLCNTAPIGLNETSIITLHDVIQVTASAPFAFSRNLTSYKQWLMMTYSRLVINQSVLLADRVITVSCYEQGQIARHFNLPLDRITVTYLAPSPIFIPVEEEVKHAWRQRLSEEFNIQKKFILGVGYEPRKNIQLLIEAYSKIATEVKDLDLVIVCANENRRLFFQRLANDMKLSENVILLGALPAESLVVLYNLAEVFVYPSERESFGLPPLEAISCGVPTIAMNSSSLPEILGDGALLVDGTDTKVWSDAILTVVRDRNLNSQLVERGITRASKLNWQRCGLDTIQVYSDVMTVVSKSKLNR